MKLKESYYRETIGVDIHIDQTTFSNTALQRPKTISLLLNSLEQDYSNMEKVDRVYIPFKYFADNKYKEKIERINNVYIYFPIITGRNYYKLLNEGIEDILNNFNIKGFVISNISQLNILKQKVKKEYEYIGNHSLNVVNSYAVKQYQELGLHSICISPELNKESINNIKADIEKEFICYGRLPLMNLEYCPVGSYPNCGNDCSKGDYKLKDRLGFEFPVVTDKINCTSIILNSKITSVATEDLHVDICRIDILDENIKQINEVINLVKQGKRLEGQVYTNGNLNKSI